MSRIKAIIIDDEPLARLNIREGLLDLTDWEVIAEFESGDIANSVFEKLSADVLFLDIQMPDVNGISLAKRLMAIPNPPLIIFVTAYDAYAIQAFELHALDYLLKPFDNPRLGQSIERAKLALKEEELQRAGLQRQQDFVSEPGYLNRLLIKSTGSIRIVDTKNVVWLASSGNYVEVHHTEGRHLHRVSLTYLEKHLDPTIFTRVHRKAIVKLSEIRELKTLPDNKYRLILSNGDVADVSKNFKDKLVERIDN